VVRLTLRSAAVGPLHCNAHDLLHGAEVQHDTRYSLRSLCARRCTCAELDMPFFLSLSPLYTAIFFPRMFLPLLAPGLTTHILEPYLTRKAQELPHVRVTLEKTNFPMSLIRSQQYENLIFLYGLYLIEDVTFIIKCEKIRLCLQVKRKMKSVTKLKKIFIRVQII